MPATAGLLVSLSTFFVPLMGVNGIVGAILGGMGLREARRRRLAGFPNTGRGFAIAAIITGILLTLLLWAATALFIWFVLWASTLPFEA